MSQSLEQFREQVLQNPPLAEQFKAVTSLDTFVDLAVQMGRQLGYNFTAEDVKTALAQNLSSSALELNDAQLASIAGGGDTSAYACCNGSTTTL